MTINDRIRYIRKEHLKMNQTQFAEFLGMKRTSISSIENGSTVTNKTITTLCLTIPQLNKEWLINGTEPKFIKPSKKDAEYFCLEDYLYEAGANDKEIAFIKTFFSFDKETRTTIIEFLNKMLKK